MAKTQSIRIEHKPTLGEQRRSITKALIDRISFDGWTLNPDNNTQIISPNKTELLGISYSENSLSTYVSTQSISMVYTPYSVSYTASNSNFYYLDFIYTKNTLAFGLRSEKGSIRLQNIIAKNEKEDWIPLLVSSNSCYFFNNNWTTPVTIGYNFLGYCSTNNPQTSIVKFPDIFNGCMFKDLYLVQSCPNTNQDKVFYINGKYYRFAGISSLGFAIPES